VFENRVVRKIFGPKRDEVTDEWRKLHNEELHNLYSSTNIRQIKSRRMRWAGQMARMEVKRKAYKVLVGKPEGKRPLGRPRHRWEDGITMDLRNILLCLVTRSNQSVKIRISKPQNTSLLQLALCGTMFQQ
jgi:CYTH domain-containing protein